MNRKIATALAFALCLAGLAAPAAASASAARAGHALFQPRQGALLAMVNQSVNASHVAGSPLPSDPDGVWDCDNYAAAKYRALRDDFGWPPTRLALGVARLPDGQKHMVVLVRAEGAWVVLDNLTDEMVPLAERTRDRWRMEFAGIEPGAPGSAAWAFVPRAVPVVLRG
jgi:predicted transglutaminase-like cysteine proteinase